jgi:hypothetical protein
MALPSEQYDLAIAWCWEYDREFIGLIQAAAAERSLSMYLISRQNLAETLDRLRDGTLAVRLMLDRASDEDELFLPLAHYLQRKSPASTRVLNPYELMRRAADKATMHLEFLTRGIHVPYTIIISPFNHKREVELSLSELARLGRPFIIKPANTTGGGVGVVVGAESLKDIIETRQHHKNDKYLLQEKIVPTTFDGQRAWFRVFYAFGEIALCWWDDQTHIYDDVTTEDEERFGLSMLRQIALEIKDVCGLEFFSTEIACVSSGMPVVVDYVNEMCDMRLKSQYADGVPDRIVKLISGRVADIAGSTRVSPATS